MISAKQAFLDSVERFLAETGMKPTNFGKEAMDDPGFVFDLRDGRSCGLDVVDRVNAFIMARSRSAQDAAE